MQLLIVSAVIIAGALLALIWVTVRVSQRRARIREQLLPALQATGLQMSGDPLGAYQLQGNYEGIDLRLENHASIQPPWSNDAEESVSCAKVTFWAPLPHSMVCPRSVQDRVVVQFPPVPRAKTGFSEFDATFEVFVDPYRRPAAQPGSASANLRWPPSETLGVLVDMNLRWLRVKDECAELVLPTIDHTRDIWRVLSLASTLAYGARGSAPTRRLQRGPLSVLPAHVSAAPSSILGIAFGAALMIAAPAGGMTICFLPLVREIIEVDVCGAGQHLLVSSSNMGDGTSYGLYCSGNPSASLALMFTICAAVSAALVLGPATLLALVSELRGSLRESRNGLE